MKFSKKISIVAMLLLAVLLTQVAYSYWANGFEIRANGSNTLNVQIGQAPGEN